MNFLPSLLMPDFLDEATCFSLMLTFKVIMVTMLLHCVAGIVFGYCLSQPAFPAQRWLDLFVTMPLVFPPVATGFALLMLFGKQGMLGDALINRGITFIFTFQGVVLAAFISGLPLVVKPVQSAMTQLTQRWAEVARTLGKKEWEILLFVLLPNIRHAMMTGLMLSAGRSLGEVGITLMLGGNISGKTNTISLEIYNAVFSGEYQRAVWLSLILACISVCIFLLLRRFSGQSRTSWNPS